MLSVFPNSGGGNVIFGALGVFGFGGFSFFGTKGGGGVISLWVGIFVLYWVYLGFAVLFGQGRVWFFGSL